MTRTKIFLLTLVIAMALVMGGLVGCSNAAQTTHSTPPKANTTGNASNANSTVDIQPTPTHIAINPVSQKILTMADNNHQIKVKPGTTIELKLDTKAYSHWLVSISRANVLIPWSNAPMPTNVQGIFNAGPSGTAQISATGQPACSSCSKGLQKFMVQIQVS